MPLSRFAGLQDLPAEIREFPMIAAMSADRDSPCPAARLDRGELGQGDAPHAVRGFIELREPGLLRNLEYRVAAFHPG